MYVQDCGKWEKSISVKDTSLTNGGHLVEAGVPVVDVAVLSAAVGGHEVGHEGDGDAHVAHPVPG